MSRRLKFVLAPDSFKGSLTALEVSKSLEKGLRRIFPDSEYVKVPMADGGEGTLRSLVDATCGTIINKYVSGPLGEQVYAQYGILGDKVTAVIEMAQASGLPLVSKDKRNPLITSTYGTGELIRAALDQGCKKLIIGIGGSATNDGGAGMASALGVRFLDSEGKDIKRGGAALKDLAKIDISHLDPRLSSCEIVVACDVINPLTGPKGASHVYGPQKGANKEAVVLLDSALLNYANVIYRDLGMSVNDIKGSGAAGGLGAGLLAFTPAVLKSGIDIVIETTGLDDKLIGADLVITGEGRTDYQTLYGKTPIGVAKNANKLGVPVVILSGGFSDDAKGLYDHGIDLILSIVKGPISIDEAVKNADLLIEDAAESIGRMIMLGMKMKKAD